MYIMAKAEYCQLHSRMVIPFCNKIHSNHIRLLATWSCENWIHSGLKWLTMSTTQPCLSLPSPLPCIYQLWGHVPQGCGGQLPIQLTYPERCCTQGQCWKMSGSASSTAARKFFTKYLPRKFSYILQEIPRFISYIVSCTQCGL